jgi:hypothetical protein
MIFKFRPVQFYLFSEKTSDFFLTWSCPILDGSKFPAAVRKRPSARNQAGTHTIKRAHPVIAVAVCSRATSPTVRIAELTRTRRPARCFPRSPHARPPGPANDRRPTTVARDDRVSSAQHAALCRGHSKARVPPGWPRRVRQRRLMLPLRSGRVGSRAPRRKLEPPSSLARCDRARAGPVWRCGRKSA